LPFFAETAPCAFEILPQTLGYAPTLENVLYGFKVMNSLAQAVQHRSSIGLSQLLQAFATLEQVVEFVASSHSQLEQAVAYED
jgi:hypothetical protein